LTFVKNKDFLKKWKHKGLQCRVLSSPFEGTLNGYVAVTEKHPAYGKSYDDLDIDVHGGLTFGSQGRKDSLRWPNPKLWWFGFDTAHAWDYVKYRDGTESEGHHWTIEEVTAEVEKMAEQFYTLFGDNSNE